MKTLRSYLFGAVLVLNAAAQGTFEGITSGSDPSPSPYSINQVAVLGPGGTWGWTFTAQSTLNVNSLGVFERILREQQSSFTVRVGLWTSSSNLVATANVSTLSPLTGQSYYESISPVTLTLGETYHLGATASASIVAEIVSAPGVSPDLSFGGIASSISDFSFPPSSPIGAGAAILFPNFTYSVPEPHPCILIIGGMFVFWLPSLCLNLRARIACHAR
jgi:hypothetical protein